MPGPQSRPFGYTADGRKVVGKSAMAHAGVKSWRNTACVSCSDAPVKGPYCERHKPDPEN